MLATAQISPAAAPDAAELARFSAQGFIILRDVHAPAAVARWREAFAGLLARQSAEQAPNRGARRFQSYLPFSAPFDDPQLFAHPRVLAAVHALLDPDPVLGLLGADTPLPGSDYQPVHQDTLHPFPGVEGLPAWALVANVPLVDYTDENGPMEIWHGGTHLLPTGIDLQRPETQALAAQLPSIRPLLRAGDVLLRDLRVWHRGTPNRSREPRPNLALTYTKPWFRLGMDLPRIARERYARMTDAEKRLMRCCGIGEAER